MKGEIIKAAQDGKLAVLKSLLEGGADPNEQDGFGNTALHFVAGGKSTECVRLLLIKGADPDILGGEDIAITPLMMAVLCDNRVNARLLLDRGADPDIENDQGDTALIYAASNGYTEMARLLMARNADINHKNNLGNTALIIAAFNGNTETVRLLVDKCADIDATNRRGSTALDHAEKAGFIEIAQIIKEAVETRQRRAEEKIRAAERAIAKRVRAQHNIAARNQRSLIASAPRVMIKRREPQP